MFCTSPMSTTPQAAPSMPPRPPLRLTPPITGGEDVEDDPLLVALRAGNRRHAAGLHQAADRGEHAAGDVHADADAVEANARGARRGGVAADRVDLAPDPVVAQEQSNGD